MLRDGSTVHMRRTSAADGALLAALLDRLSPEALWLRFLGTVAVAAAAERLVTEGTGLVALAGTPSRAVAHACLPARGRGSRRGGLRGRRRLAGPRSRDAAPRPPRAALRGAGDRDLHRARRSLQPQDARRLPASPGSRWRSGRSPAPSCSRCRRSWVPRRSRASRSATTSRRWRRSVTSSTPSSIAVIGASRRRGGVGGVVVRNIVAGGFGGALYPINPHARSIAGRRAYASLGDVPGPVELAIVAVSAEQVVRGRARVRRPRRARARGALGGLRRDGPRGRGSPGGAPRRLSRRRPAARRAQLPRRPEHRPGRPARRHVRTRPAARRERRLRVAERRPTASPRSTWPRRRGLGLSSFVSMGNKADLSGNDFLRFWEHDPAHGRRPALPRVARQPAALRPHRAAR